MNYLAANKRRVQILAEAKEVRVAAALKAKRIKESIAEYELAVRLAHKYGFAAIPPPQASEAPVESKEAYAPTPPTPELLVYTRRPVIIERAPRVDLPRKERTPESVPPAYLPQPPLAVTTRREVGFDSPSRKTGGVNITPIMKRQGEVERLGLGFTSAQFQMILPKLGQS
ncbi:hypothetical protein T492DRAFT_883565 [Pavlovales sp. CCMP2436]|nr:hypothetical protein T492DRAFT_883565 [Pavlovales sp. CCMP2436]